VLGLRTFARMVFGWLHRLAGRLCQAFQRRVEALLGFIGPALRAASRNFWIWVFFAMTPNIEREEIRERDTFYAEVGQGISAWAKMESKLIHVAAHLLDTDIARTGVVLYSVTSFYTWLNIIDELLSLNPRLATTKRDWCKISDRLRKLNDTRVRLAHHTVWHSRQKQGVSLLPVKEDQRLKSRALGPLDAREITTFSRATLQMARDLNQLLERLRSTRIVL